MIINVLAFTGGFVIMALEMLGGRILAPYFGGSIYVWGSIISVFMLALAFGYLLGGRLSLRQPSLRRFGLVLLIAALLLYPLAIYTDPLLQLVFTYVEDPRYGSLLAAALLFAMPTVILGVISPYAVRLSVEHADQSGSVAGRLYFVSTLGSALGTLATSFYFVLWFEINTIISLLTVALVAMSALAWFADR
jgi:hypothetical protein